MDVMVVVMIVMALLGVGTKLWFDAVERSQEEVKKEMDAIRALYPVEIPQSKTDEEYRSEAIERTLTKVFGDADDPLKHDLRAHLTASAR